MQKFREGLGADSLRRQPPLETLCSMSWSQLPPLREVPLVQRSPVLCSHQLQPRQ